MTTTSELIRDSLALTARIIDALTQPPTRPPVEESVRRRHALDRFIRTLQQPSPWANVSVPLSVGAGRLLTMASPDDPSQRIMDGVLPPGMPGDPGDSDDPNLIKTLEFLEKAHRDFLNGDVDGYLRLINALPGAIPPNDWARRVTEWTRGDVTELDSSHLPFIQKVITDYLHGLYVNDDRDYSHVLSQAAEDTRLLLALEEMALGGNHHIARRLHEVSLSRYASLVHDSPAAAYAVALAGIFENEQSQEILDGLLVFPDNGIREAAHSGAAITAWHFLNVYLVINAPTTTTSELPQTALVAEDNDNELAAFFRAHFSRLNDNQIEKLFSRPLRPLDPIQAWHAFQTINGCLPGGSTPRTSSSFFNPVENDRSSPIRLYYQARFYNDFRPNTELAAFYLWMEASHHNHYALRALLSIANPLARKAIASGESSLTESETRILNNVSRLDIDTLSSRLRHLPLEERFDLVSALHELKNLHRHDGATRTLRAENTAVFFFDNDSWSELLDNETVLFDLLNIPNEERTLLSTRTREATPRRLQALFHECLLLHPSLHDRFSLMTAPRIHQGWRYAAPGGGAPQEVIEELARRRGTGGSNLFNPETPREPWTIDFLRRERGL